MEYGPYIVIEGPDGTGKTTLAAEIVRRTGANYLHCGPPDRPALDFYLGKLRSVKGPTVVDRLHVGSYVYGLAFRNAPDMSDFENWLIEGFLYAHGAQLVYCDAPRTVIDKNLARGPDNPDASIYEAPAKRTLVRTLYERRLMSTELPLVRYDYTSYAGAFEDTVESIHETLVIDALLHSTLPELDAIGNTVFPKYVLVADRPSWYDRAVKHACGRGMTPWERSQFLTRVNRRSHDLVLASTSGRYMYMAIKSAELKLSEFAMLNSVQGDGRRLSGGMEMTPMIQDDTDVVALGRNAATELIQAAQPYRVIPHPQHWRRFHYKDVLEYADMLRGARAWDGERGDR